MKSILYDTQKSENSKNYQHKFTNFCNIITSQAYKTGGETIEKKYVFYKPGNIYALYYRKENTLYVILQQKLYMWYKNYLSDLIKKSRVHTNSESLLFLIKVFSFIKFF